MADTPLAPPAPRRRGLPMLAALGEPNFRLYWAGLISYVLAWRIEYVTYAWVVWELTSDPLYLGFYGLAEAVPLVLCQLFGGVLADRTRRLRLLIGTQCVTAATLTVAFLLTASGLIRIELIYPLVALSATFRAFEQPTRMALIPSLIPRDKLPNAITIGSVPWQTGRILGPALAGLLIAAFGAAVGFACGALAYYLAIAFYTRLHIPDERRASPAESPLRALAVGLRFVASSPLFASLIALTFFNSVFGMAYISLLPVYADQYFGVGSSGYGLMQTVGGLGAILGTVILAAVAHRLRHRGRVMLAGGALFGLFLAAFSQSPTLPVALAMLALMGISNTFYLTLASIVLQEQVPGELRGRVLGIYGLAFNVIPLGGLLAGATAAAVNARFAVLVGGLLVAGMALAVLVFGRRLRAVQ
jgi:MFS family permease